ncbi:Aldo/keto reductase [Irpex rosettiformis]|uniref:Aldo/keto reductase n=1 Tax=Irpex rosettiformis TaxID=378272 RepID=A0ACB8TRB7_9APHY|nr:Aldo/keto reductase [Irpex rosettiformis]
MAAADVPQFTFNNGIKVPSVGMGCWMGADGGLDKIEDMCKNAIKNGYRHLDTACGYNNEQLVGKAIRESGVPRSEIFLTTKLGNSDHGRVREAFEDSLAKLGVEYIDLYLMHWPQAIISASGGFAGQALQPDESPTLVETWKEMEKLLDTGKVKSIGVSNFSIKTLETLLAHAKVVPVTNQIELHPLYPQFELQKYCQDKGILLTAYSPLGQGRPEFFQDSDYAKIVEAHKVNPAQIAISWLVQRGIIAIPKSANVERMKTNITLISLSPEELTTVSSIHKKTGQHRSLMTYGGSKPGEVFGWTYEQLGWNLKEGGFVKDD